MSGEDAQLFTAERRTPSSTARRSTSAWSATSSTSSPAIVHGLLDDGRIPVVSSVVARGDDGERLQRQRRHRGRRARRRAAAPRSSSCSPTSRACTPTGPAERRGHQRSCTADELDAAAADAVERHGPEDGGVPARGPRRRRRARTSSTAGCRTRCCSRSSPTRASGRWWCHERHDDRATGSSRWDAALMAQLRHAAAVALVRGEGCGSGTPTAATTSTWSPASRCRRSATRTRRRRGRHRQVATLAHTSQPLPERAGVALAERLLDLARRAGDAGVLLQLRRRGQRGRAQDRRGGRRPGGRGSSPPSGVPRPHDGRAGAHRASRRSASRSSRCGRRHVRPVRRRRRAARPPSTTIDGRGRSSSRCSARPASSRRPRLPRGRARDLRRSRRAARARRGPERHRPHRRVVRPPARRASGPTSSPSRRGSAAACRSAPASRIGDAANALAEGRPRHDVRRQPGRRAPPRSPCST